METQQFTVESLRNGERRTVIAADWWQALADLPEPCFTVVRRHDGSYSACTIENEAFPVAGEHIASTPEAAAAAIRQHCKDMKRKHNRNQTPIHAPQYCVIYLKDGKEKRGAWMSRERAQQAAAIMRAKYGERSATVYMD